VLLEMHARSYARITCLICAAWLASCASQPQQWASTPEWSAHQQTATEAETCREVLAASGRGGQSELDSSDIHVFNWNMQKVRDAGSLEDLNILADDKDLILIQEAALKGGLLQPFRKARFWSFAPGYRSGEELTGVMTMSASMPLARCSLTSWEPWLGTPKATSVTEYALSGTDETLVVVNIHAVNFTFGLRHFREQLERISAVLPDHGGPVILSGDFNTWRKKRLDLVGEISGQLGLRAIHFDDDRRSLAFGNAVDHIYVRGLSKREASTRVVSTSDHNPMTVRLSR